MSEPHVITRDRILQGEIDRRLFEAERLGLLTRLPEAARIAAREHILAELDGGDVWVFGYGSLIWNPAFDFVERQRGRIHGWRRRFCLETPIGRGSPERPGLMLGLDRGGSCHGVVFRLDPANAVSELDIVFRREMVSDAYRPRLVRAQLASGPVRAVAFIMNRGSERYRGDLGPETTADMIASAEGWLGSCSDYLFRTAAHLRELDLKDRDLFRLERLVRDLQGAG